MGVCVGVSVCWCLRVCVFGYGCVYGWLGGWVFECVSEWVCGCVSVGVCVCVGRGLRL